MRGIYVAVLLASGSALTIAQTADTHNRRRKLFGVTRLPHPGPHSTLRLKPSQAGGGFLQLGFVPVKANVRVRAGDVQSAKT